MAFTVHGDGTATGRTLPMGVGFMESRSQRTPEARSGEGDLAREVPDRRVTRIAPWPLLQVPSPRWALAVALPSCRYDLEPGRWAWLRDPVSGSWASVVPLDDGQYLVRQCGVRRLWDEAEAAYRWWRSRGEPFITQWRWTITPERQGIQLPG